MGCASPAAAPAAGEVGAEAAEEQSEFEIFLSDVGDKKIDVIFLSQNIKKRQFILKTFNEDSIKESGNKNILITERGNTFGFDSLVTDLKSIPIMQSFGYPIIFDATHSAQIPGNHESKTGGNRQFIPSQTFAAVSSGANGIFMEVHDDVDHALSDASTQWPIDKLEKILTSIIAFRETFLSHG